MTLLEAMDWTGRIFTGSWTSAGGGTLASTEPATEQTPAEVGLTNKGDVAAAAARAGRAASVGRHPRA
jgi:benzaldehyde dehydrogenase (NAD)